MKTNILKFKRRCEARFEDFEGVHMEIPEKPEKRYRFIDNGKDILAIAHLDYIGGNHSFGVMKHNGIYKAFHGGMDDRSGAYIILDHIPAELGETPYDILLTDCEERGQSTGQYFSPPEGRTYKWMFEFDREGLDCATYDFGSDDLDKVIKKHGWNPVRGSLTDMCKMYDLGCRGFNFGNGNHNGHGEWNHVVLSELETSATWFCEWYKAFKDTAFPFDEKKDRRKYSYSSNVKVWRNGKWIDDDGSAAEGYEGYGYGFYGSGLGEWDYVTHSYKPKSNNGKHKKKSKGIRLLGSGVAVVGGGQEEKDADQLPTSVYDQCDECDTYKELDPQTYLCEDCTKHWTEDLGMRPTNYRWRNKEEPK